MQKRIKNLIDFWSRGNTRWLMNFSLIKNWKIFAIVPIASKAHTHNELPHIWTEFIFSLTNLHSWLNCLVPS